MSYRLKSDDFNLSSLFIPIPVKSNPDDINVGAELTGDLKKTDLIRILNKFYQTPEVKMVLQENGLDNYLQQQVYVEFRKFCSEVKNLPVDLHITISDILQGAGNVTDMLPFFLRHARQMFPHLECMDDLKKISDLRNPAIWYPEARKRKRKIIFHAGPTNSGKTYQALQRFLNSKSGIYCGPLKLLAAEVFKKANEHGTPCDLVTGEERKYAINADNPASHVSCTVEMSSVMHEYEVAVIDEIQLLRDPMRGWAWTRALLGIVADEVHVCGEEGAVDLVRSIMSTTDENVEVFKYNRLTDLHVENHAVRNLDNIQDGDCIVCFSKNDVYSVSTGIESRGKEVSVIYGALPPGTKLAQAQKFNDPTSSCKVLVATDAIGMGLNLSIRRVIFYSLVKPTTNEKGEKSMDFISVSQAKQIAGRAGRYGTQYETGYVTTFRPDDLPKLKELVSQTPEPIDKAGIHPTAEQIELYSYHLQQSSLSNLIDIFIYLSTVDDSLYFLCAIEDFKFLANMIQHIPLNLRARYMFCCAPINRRMPFVCSMFRKYAIQYSKNEPITFEWICRQIGWPLTLPKNILALVHLEMVFDVLDLYLWFSYRFPDIFVEPEPVRHIQAQLDSLIQQGVVQITRLLKNSDRSNAIHIEDDVDEPVDTKEVAHGKGNLTKRLLREGLLTPEILEQLQKEWINENRDIKVKTVKTSSSPSTHSTPPPRTVKPRKKR
ncbi:hypothetical protein V9T40_010141 [Parthenolecanium corni]|uniref:ATP-dependent RNA helicase SUV3 homolog, mitochondrial n=1 Tax=Parthenolecanium corni TaxID=536013 RepID=A0AAN9XWJ1_9HEMI